MDEQGQHHITREPTGHSEHHALLGGYTVARMPAERPVSFLHQEFIALISL
jgi:hypothetical protein